MDFLATQFERQFAATSVHARTDNYYQKLEASNKHLKEQLESMRAYVKELELAVNRDPLVDVCNRRAFMREMSRARSVLERYHIPSSVIYLDLDDFKTVNDVHGHCVGDELLKRVGGVLSASIRECDMVARLGGDEFAILMFKTDLAGAKIKAAFLANLIAEIEIGTVRGMVTTQASWGVATCENAVTPQDTLSIADQEMYIAKRLVKETS